MNKENSIDVPKQPLISNEVKKGQKCPWETTKISCTFCGGTVNVAPAGPGVTEIHCDECGAHYINQSH